MIERHPVDVDPAMSQTVHQLVHRVDRRERDGRYGSSSGEGSARIHPGDTTDSADRSDPGDPTRSEATGRSLPEPRRPVSPLTSGESMYDGAAFAQLPEARDRGSDRKPVIAGLACPGVGGSMDHAGADVPAPGSVAPRAHRKGNSDGVESRGSVPQRGQ